MKDNPIIAKMTSEIVKICSPFQIYLVSFKLNSKGELTAFKVCIITGDSYDIVKLESDILLSTDCPVPCDIIMYHISEWNNSLEDDCTFAYRVENAGELLYEQE